MDFYICFVVYRNLNFCYSRLLFFVYPLIYFQLCCFYFENLFFVLLCFTKDTRARIVYSDVTMFIVLINDGYYWWGSCVLNQSKFVKGQTNRLQTLIGQVSNSQYWLISNAFKYLNKLILVLQFKTEIWRIKMTVWLIKIGVLFQLY